MVFKKVLKQGDIKIQDEGTQIGARETINFIGAGVTAADDAVNNRVNVNIPGGGVGADTKVNVFEAGTQVGTVARQLDFTQGNDFDITEDAVNDQFDIAIRRNVANGVAGLDASALIALAQIPVHSRSKHDNSLIPNVATDPTTPADGDIWHNSTDGYLKIRVAGVTRRLMLWDDIINKPSTFPPSTHASLHHSGGADALSLGSIAGTITDTQHGNRGSGLHADSHARSHDHSLAADGSPIAIAGVPDLPATKITSGRFGMARMPDGTLNYVLTAKGAGVDPAYEPLPAAAPHKATHVSGGTDAFVSTDLLDGVARVTVRENTGLNVGSRRRLNFIEGSNVTLTITDDATDEEVDITIAAATGAAVDPLTTVDLADDFICGTTEVGEIGELGWSVGGTSGWSASHQPSLVNRPGIFRIHTPATLDAYVALHSQTSRLNDVIDPASSFDIMMIIRVQSVTAITIRFGLFADVAAASAPSIMWEFHSPTDTFWTMVTCVPGAVNRVASDVAPAVDTWYKLRIKRVADGVEFYLNDVLKGTITTNIPTEFLNICFGIITREAVAKTGDIDFARIRVTGLTR